MSGDIAKRFSVVPLTKNDYGIQSKKQCLAGRAIAQAVSRWLPTMAARVRVRVWQVGFVVDKVALGRVFSAYLGFLCQYSFPQIFHHHNHPGQV
jgi:hypothetical protein